MRIKYIMFMSGFALLVGLMAIRPAYSQHPGPYSEGGEMEDHYSMMPHGMEHPSMEGHPGMDGGWGHGYGHEYGGGGRDHWMKPHNAAVHFLEMKDALGLNEKQITELKGLRDSYRAENEVNEAKLKIAEDELRELLQEDAINLEKAEGKLKEIGALEGPVWSGFIKQLARIKAIIPKEQMRKMHQMRGGQPMMERE